MDLQQIPLCSVLLFCTLLLLPSLHSKQCPKCGSYPVPYPVPYPLSTGPGCGDPLYWIRCSAGTLWFDAANGSTTMIQSINPMTQRMILRPPGFDGDTCMAADISIHGIQLERNRPFNVTDSNTVVLMNCTEDAAAGYGSNGFDCSSSSACHRYLKENPLARTNCRNAPFCCLFRTGGSMNEYKVYRARKEKCSAYQSYVNLDPGQPVSKWGEPGVEIEWALPTEPVCRLPIDCQDLRNSVCSADPGNTGQRCLCMKGLQWDPINGVCKVVKCSHGKGCERQNKVALLAGLICGGGVILIAGLVTRVVFKRKREADMNRTSSTSHTKLFGFIMSANSGGLERVYTGRDILKATNNFSGSNLLGVGGFGEVFKGVLDDGTIVAVKRAKFGNETSIGQITNEVRILCQVNHRNLVKLLGCCIELDLPILIYEYIPNGTLFDHLHGAEARNRLLTWRRRLQIALQAAQGIDYLHSSARPPIFHRDIKSSNILLDGNLDARVADFGISKLRISEVSHVTTSAQGTLGYLDPDYYLNFQLTDKSDVYSFGVVLLELLTGKKAIDFRREEEDVNLVVLGRKRVKEGTFVEVVDPMIRERATESEIQSMRKLGFLADRCLQEVRHCRPSMKTVAREIEMIVDEVASSASIIIPAMSVP